MVEIYVLSVICRGNRLWSGYRTGCWNVRRSYYGLRSPRRSCSTYLRNDSWVQTVHWSNFSCSQFRQNTSNLPFIFRPLNKTGWLRSSNCNNVGGNKFRLSTICAVFSISVKVCGKVAATISNKFYQGALAIITFMLIFAGIALKLENAGPTFSCFNPHTSLLFVETDDRKQFQCLNIVFNNKTAPLLIF